MSVSIRRIGRQGNSLSLTVPREFVRTLKLNRGDQVVVDVVAGGLRVRKLTGRLADALADHKNANNPPVPE